MAPDRAPATFGQRLLWLAEHYRGDNGNLNVFSAYRAEGDLDVAAAVAAFWALADAHGSLRTTFHRRGRQLEQMIDEKGARPEGVVSCVDVSADCLAPFVAEEAAIRFDLNTQWPYRARVAAMGGGVLTS